MYKEIDVDGVTYNIKIINREGVASGSKIVVNCGRIIIVLNVLPIWNMLNDLLSWKDEILVILVDFAFNYERMLSSFCSYCCIAAI